MKVKFIFIVLCLSGVVNLVAQQTLLPSSGDPAIAEKYLLWAKEAIDEGRWTQARAALERAADFADVSSDISYLTALARFRANESGAAVLESLDKAIQTGRWSFYSEAEARLVQAEQLIIMRRYADALDSLASPIAEGGYNSDTALLRLAAFKGLKRNSDFRLTMRDSLERYPRDTRHLHILFDYARENKLNENDPLMIIALSRIPFLFNEDPDLVWKAALCIEDEDEARRLTAEYRGGSYKMNPASIVPALNFGLLYDEDAVNEFFSFDTDPVLDKRLFTRIWELLRSEEGREYFAGKASSYNGVIIEDEDRDGYPESRAVYRNGILQEYYFDADQDGIDELFIIFDSGNPRWALIRPSGLLSSADILPVQIFWEKYPHVQRAVQGNETWLFGPAEFMYAPIDLEEIGASLFNDGLIFPQRHPGNMDLNRRILASSAYCVFRPGMEFDGSVERFFLQRGIPVRSEVILNQRIVSITEFENGSPVIQRLDLDADGTMETIRRFRRIFPGEVNSSAGSVPDYRQFIRSSESTRNGSPVFSSAELYPEDGSIVYIWDLDGNGIRDYYLIVE